MTYNEFKRRFLPPLIKVGIGVGIGVVVLVLTQGWVFEISVLQDIELLTVDYRYQNAYDPEAAKLVKDNADVVIVGIADEDLVALPEAFPFPRNYYAHLVRNLTLAGARAIVFDITFETEREGDDVFADMLRRVNNVVLAAKVQTGAGSEFAEVRSLDKTYNNVFYKDNRNLGIGIVNIIKDRDDVCRRYMPMIIAEGELTPTLAFAGLNKVYQYKPLTTVQIADGAFVYRDKVIPAYNPTSFLLNYYGPVETFRYIPFSQVIDDQSFKTQDEIDYEMDINMFDESVARLVRGKVVLVGSLMAEERDYHNVPLYTQEGNTRNFAMHGVEIHATALQNVLDGRFVSVVDPVTQGLIVILFSVVGFTGLLALKRLKVRYAWLLEIGVFLTMILTIGAFFEIGVLLFSSNNLLMSIVNPSFAVVLAYLSTAVYQYLEERQQKAMIKGVFSHYLNPSVVNMLVTDPSKAKLGGDRRELTVFFSDIAGFTTISEHFHDKPEGLVDLLNEYLDEMTNIVLKYDGTLDKYEGDAVMAFWGAPIMQKDHALRASFAALEMQNRLAELRPRWKKEGKPELVARIGLNTGVCIAGNMGGRDRFDYTVIGDSVNLASRLEGANKQYGSYIMLSEFTYKQVKDRVMVRELDLIQVKGKTEPVRVYELLGKKDLKLSDNQKQSLEIFHEGLKLYRQKQWDEAIAYMQQAQELDPACGAATIYIERANLYKIAPPAEDWNGVFVMTTK